LWTNVDLVEQVNADSVAEDLVLTGPGAAASYTFGLSGALARANASGGLDLIAGGKTVGVIPALTVSTSSPQPKATAGLKTHVGSSRQVTAASGAKFIVAGGQVSVSVSSTWLASLPKAAFPVVIDPSFYTAPAATQTEAFSSFGDSMSGQAAVGQDSSGAKWNGAADIPFPSPPPISGQQPWVPTSAFFFAGCANGQPCSMENNYLCGEESEPTYYGQVDCANPMYTQQGGGLQGKFNVNILSWFSGHRTGSWFGFGGDGESVNTVTGVLTPTKLLFANDMIYVAFTYYQEPPAPTVTSPVSGSLSSSSTPTLTGSTVDTAICTYTAQPPVSDVFCDQPYNVLYDFTVRTSPFWNAGQTVADSGWIPQPYTTGTTNTANGYPITTTDPSWTVPGGSLSDGMTYYVSVQDSDSNQNPLAASPVIANDAPLVPAGIAFPAVKFTVKQRLGAGGPSPTDMVGSPPGQASAPSAGSPSPGTAPSSETVNMVTGNLALSLGTPSMKTLAGPDGVSLAYNSAQSSTLTGSNYGLTGSFYTDSGSHSFPASAVGTQVQPNIDVTNDMGTPPIGGIQPYTPYMARWTGTITLPPGTWQLGGVSSGGMRAYLDGSTTPIYDDWAGGSQALAFGAGKVSGLHQIEVDAWDPGGDTTMQLWANNVTSQSAPVPVVVGSSWLTPSATGLPPGWSMSSTAAAWTSVTDLGTQVVVHSPTGAAAAFTLNSNGTYTPQAGDTDALTEVNGQVQLSTTSGYLYRFTTSGLLISMTTVADDRNPTALRYTYGPESAAAGAPVVLQTITDPVSTRTITLSYGGAAACTTTNTAGLLCGISYWDATSSTFTYNTNQQLAEVLSPGGNTTLIGYDANNRVDDIRDALANDYLAAGGLPSCTTVNQSCAADTWLSYDSLGRVLTVTQPQPVVGAARPQRTYTYLPSTTTPGAGSTRLAIAGFNPPGAGTSPPGVASTAVYDAQSRVVSQTNSSGLTAQTVWDNQDRPIISLDTTGEQTSTVSDIGSNVTDTYGPAPAACFDPATIPSGLSVPAPVVGYLPLANAATTSGCEVAVPHTHSGYDEGITGLADTYWSNGQYGGAAAAHGTGNGGTPNSACTYFTGGSSANSLCGSWPAGTTPPGVSTDASNQWSTKMTGTITIPSSGMWIFCVADTQEFTMSIDSVVVLTNINYDLYGQKHGNSTSSCADSYRGQDSPYNGDGNALSAGQHTIEIDMLGSPSQATSYTVSWVPPGDITGSVLFPQSALAPAYGLKTSTTDPDAKTATSTYTAANIGAEDGLPTATTIGTGASALTTTTAYETPGAAGSYLRRTSTTLPAGNSTSYTYYDGTGGPIATACGVSASTPQGGELKTQTDPATSPGGPSRVQQFVYDAAGRAVGRRVGSSTTIAGVAWQCTTNDLRGRVTSTSWPATSSSAARTTTYTYSVGGNPLKSSVQDGNGTITSTVDLLGRMVSYQDATGNTSTVAYNRAAQVTSTTGPEGVLTNSYDSTSGQPLTVSDNGALLATAIYSPTTRRLTGVTYVNGTTSAVTYDPYGRQNSLVSTKTSGGTLITGDQSTNSLGGRITSELENINGTSLTNPNPAGDTATDYTYDPAGRLSTAYIPGAVASYGYATNPGSDGCANPGQGANTNRTSVTTTPTNGSPATVDSCYNTADQLVSTKTGVFTNGGFSYDDHGNQTMDNATTLTYDSADRLASTTISGSTTTYTFDAVDRVIARTTGASTTHYAYEGFTDSPAATLTSTNTVVQQFIGLPGGVMVNVQTSGNIWSYPDLHGNYTVTTNNTGATQGNPATYDPWGQLTAGDAPVNNATGGSNLGAFGAAGKVTDTTTNITIMGARPYNPTEARFYTVDPILGGCANPYTYGFGDPLNHQDLTGRQDCSNADAVGFLAALAGLGVVGVAIFSGGAEVAAGLGAASAVLGVVSATIDAASCYHGNHVACGAVGLSVVSIAAGFGEVSLGAKGAAAVSGTYGAGAFGADFGSGYRSIACGLGNLISGGINAVGNWIESIFLSFGNMGR
jgi:RHS repeat-associated protein